ncbi:MAG TPA: hypothetical protein VHW23_29830 [Kofleriaceae bacterium]|nr:hypothetical protein [Kofleriaceae bacterium]
MTKLVVTGICGDAYQPVPTPSSGPSVGTGQIGRLFGQVDVHIVVNVALSTSGSARDRRGIVIICVTCPAFAELASPVSTTLPGSCIPAAGAAVGSRVAAPARLQRSDACAKPGSSTTPLHAHPPAAIA